ncbi:MAG: prolyl oligopeptidase family serine peptidase, partial [Rhodanobacter sp.]
WRVPMLVVHSGKDFRIPITQGLGAFTALQRRGIPSEFLTFPDENHWVLKPHNSVQWHDTVNAWLKQWTAKDAPSGASKSRRRAGTARRRFPGTPMGGHCPPHASLRFCSARCLPSRDEEHRAQGALLHRFDRLVGTDAPSGAAK